MVIYCTRGPEFKKTQIIFKYLSKYKILSLREEFGMIKCYVNVNRVDKIVKQLYFLCI